MESVRRHRDIKVVTTNERRNRLVSEPHYYKTKMFSENLLAIEMKKKPKVKMNEPVYLGLSILEISKTLMYEFWYDCIKPKYQENAKLCYMETDSLIINIKTEENATRNCYKKFYEHIANDVEKEFNISNYDVDEWNIQLTMAINFISSEDSGETRNIYTKSDNIKL